MPTSSPAFALALEIQYHYVPEEKNGTYDLQKYQKYLRDIETTRGIINVVGRETEPYCDCLKDAKKKAKSMAKLGWCQACRKCFPKQTMLQCSVCNIVQYCSTECQLEDWSEHKKYCKGAAKNKQSSSGDTTDGGDDGKRNENN